MNREQTLSNLRTTNKKFDVVVIGGGATGIGCALDAITRGLNVLLIDKHDFGKGTSSRSTKLVHGGVRYLAQGNISLVREALHERGVLFQMAPDLVRRLEFVVPTYSFTEHAYYGAGLKTYDLLAGKHGLGTSHFLGKAKTLEKLPDLESKKLFGAIAYFDGQFDDSRFLIELAKYASDSGALLLNYASIEDFQLNSEGKIVGLFISDLFTGEKFSLSCKAVINATGIYSDEIRRLVCPSADRTISFSRGSHIVVKKRFLSGGSALMIPKTSDGRVLFLIPWKANLLIGTTDIETNSPVIEPRANQDEIAFLLDTSRRYLTTPPTNQDILSCFSGIRPLYYGTSGGKTSAISRDHHLETLKQGLVSISGGKWTTFRRMAEDTIDLICREFSLSAGPCITESIRIKNSVQFETGFPELNEGLLDYFVRSEMAETVEDILARRVGILFSDTKSAMELAPKTAKLLANALGRNQSWEANQLESFLSTAKSYLPNPTST